MKAGPSGQATMPVPAPNLYPPFNIIRLSHVELGVTDLARSRAFYVDTLGLQVTDEAGDEIYLRGLEERGHHCLILKKSKTAQAGPALSASAVPLAASAG